MALIPSVIGLTYTSLVLGAFAVMMIWFPQWMLESYKINLTNTTATEKLILTSLLQYLGLNYTIGVGVSSLATRLGNDSTRGTICLVNFVWHLFSAGISLGSYKYWTDIGMAAGGIWFNTCLLLLGAVLNLLGCFGSNVFAKLAPIGKPMYWGFFPAILCTTFYMVAMFFFPAALMKGYGVVLTGQTLTVYLGMLRFGVAPYYIYTILSSIAQFFIEPHVTYVFVRYLAIMFMALSVFYLITAATWKSLETNHEYMNLIRGQYANAIIFLFFFVLFYLPVALMDGEMKGSVLAALGLKASNEEARDAEKGWSFFGGADEEEEEDAE